MRFKTLEKTLTVTEYMIRGAYDSPYAGVSLRVDYINSTHEMFQQLRDLEEKNPTVKYVDYNKARGCIEITIK